MRTLRTGLAAALLLMAAAAWGQTTTTSSTSVPLPAITQPDAAGMARSFAQRQVVFFQDYQCLAPPCASNKAHLFAGHHSFHIENTGTATAAILCKQNAQQTATYSIGSITGASQSADVESDALCAQAWVNITACTSGTCTVSAYVTSSETY